MSVLVGEGHGCRQQGGDAGGFSPGVCGLRCEGTPLGAGPFGPAHSEEGKGHVRTCSCKHRQPRKSGQTIVGTGEVSLPAGAPWSVPRAAGQRAEAGAGPGGCAGGAGPWAGGNLAVSLGLGKEGARGRWSRHREGSGAGGAGSSPRCREQMGCISDLRKGRGMEGPRRGRRLAGLWCGVVVSGLGP